MKNFKSFHLFSCILAAFVILCTGAVPAWSWTRQLGIGGNDAGWGVATDSSGNAYVTGQTENGGSLDDLILVKYNSSGVKQWTQELGTTSNDVGRGVATDSSGNVYVTGYTNGGLDGNTSAGGSDLILVKYNSSGTKQWTQQLGTTSDDRASGVATDSSGNAYVTGYTVGGLDGNTNAGSEDLFLVKYNSSGAKQWARQLGTTSTDTAMGVATDSSGNAYVTGQTYGGLDGNTNAGNADLFLAKYNSSGVSQWTLQLGTASDDLGIGVATDSSGNVYVTGYTRGELYGNTSSGQGDFILVKYDSSGTKQWTHQLGTTSNDYGYGVATDSSDNAYVTGYTHSSLDGNTSAGGADLFLVKYNSSGTKQWTRQLGTTSNDYGFGVATDSSDNAYVTGYTHGSLDGNTSAGGADLFLIKYDSSGVSVDGTAPTNSTTPDFINSGAATATSTTVTLSLSATDNVGVTGYYASETSTTPSASNAGWTAVTSTTSYSANASFVLSSGDGTKAVYVWFKDAAGNVSSSVSDTISLGATAPTVNAGTDKTASASFTQDATVTGATTYLWTKQSGPGTITFGSATTEDTTISASADGTYVIRLTATDDVDNSAYDEMVLTWATTSYTLTITKAGTGSGTITVSPGTLSWSGNTGTATYDAGTYVTLTATANSGSTFIGWSGGSCSGTGTCAGPINANANITATFDTTVPVNLSSFTAISDENKTSLFWRTESETDNYGWNIYRSSELNGDYEKINASVIRGAGTSSTAYIYKYQDPDDGENYYYLEDIALSGEKNKNLSFLTQAVPQNADYPITMDSFRSMGKGDNETSFKTQDSEIFGPREFTTPRAKLLVDQEGTYRITYSDLQAAGVNPSTINPDNLQLTNKGKPVPFTLATVNEEDVFGETDYLEFDGTFNRGVYTYENIYTRSNVYWLSWKEIEKPIVRSEDIVAEKPLPKVETIHFEENNVWSALGHAPDGKRDHWFWKRIDAPNNHSFSFSLEGPLPLNQNVLFKVRLQGNSHLKTNPDHKTAITLNGTFLKQIEWDGQNDTVLSMNLPSETFVEGENVLKIEAFGANGEVIDSIFLDWFDVNYSGNALTAKELLKPVAILPDEPSTLRNMENQGDYLIITHGDFLEQAAILASHRQSNGLKTSVINIADIYDEFSHGIFNPEAIKDFLAHTYTHWQNPAPQYVLLLGGANLDYKDNSHTGFRNYVPTYPYFSPGYGQTASDHWFACLTDDAVPDMSIGRLPAHTSEEAKIMVDKIINYSEGVNSADWKNKVLFINGGYDPMDEKFFDASSEALISDYLSDKHEALRVYNKPSREDLSAYQGSTSEIADQINNGVGLVNFLGHAATGTWDLMFKVKDIEQLSNGDRLPFILGMSCFTGDFANKIISEPVFLWITTEVVSGFGERFLKKEDGGAIAFWGTTAVGLIHGDSYLDDELFRVLFTEKVGSIGKAIKEAEKQVLDKYPAYRDLIYTFVLLGDPALDLPLDK